MKKVIYASLCITTLHKSLQNKGIWQACKIETNYDVSSRTKLMEVLKGLFFNEW